MLWLENNASLFSVRKNKRSKDLIIPAQKYLTFVSRFYCPEIISGSRQNSRMLLFPRRNSAVAINPSEQYARSGVEPKEPKTTPASSDANGIIP